MNGRGSLFGHYFTSIEWTPFHGLADLSGRQFVDDAKFLVHQPDALYEDMWPQGDIHPTFWCLPHFSIFVVAGAFSPSSDVHLEPPASVAFVRDAHARVHSLLDLSFRQNLSENISVSPL